MVYKISKVRVEPCLELALEVKKWSPELGVRSFITPAARLVCPRIEPLLGAEGHARRRDFCCARSKAHMPSECLSMLLSDQAPDA